MTVSLVTADIFGAMFDTVRMTYELMQAHHAIDHAHTLSMLQLTQLDSSSSSSSSGSSSVSGDDSSVFSLSDYADRYTTARDAYLHVMTVEILRLH